MPQPLIDRTQPPEKTSPLSAFRWMALARELDRVLCEMNPRWFPCVGEEAAIVGTFVDLRPTDIVAPHYRDPFVVYLMRGADMSRLVAQVLGRTTGYSAGRAVPFTGPAAKGVVPWVAGDLGTSLGVATGGALAHQQRGTDDVCVCTFGDGTANRGDFHEALNLAATWKLPIVFVCQNNGWAISQPSSSYLTTGVYKRAAGYGMSGEVVDGQDIEAVREVVSAAVVAARAGSGPALIEARTWRAKGHWAGDDQTYRDSPDEPGRDPLEVSIETLRRDGISALEVDQTRDEVRRLVADAVNAASAAPAPTAADLALDQVYR